MADESPIATAAEKGDTATVRSLLSAGTSVNEQRADGATSLLLAALSGHTETVQLLLEHNAEPGLAKANGCLLYTSPSPRDATLSRMPSSA